MEFDFTKEPGKTRLKPYMEEELTPLVSIITPYYNADKYFEQTFNCVINQTFPWFEWIIVDDGSTEQMPKLIKLVENDRRIKVIHQKNKGQSAARNAGIHAACTDIIIPLDADDLIIPSYLECVFWGLKMHPDATWCYTDSVGFQGENYIWKKKFSTEHMKKENLLVCTAAIRKKAIIEIGGYNESNKHYDEDWKLWLDLLAQEKYPIHLNIIGFWYRRTGNGMGSQVRANNELKAKSDNLVQESADKVTHIVKAIEYPTQCSSNNFFKPFRSSWNLHIPKKSAKKHIFMIFPWLEMGGADLFNLELVKKLDKSIYDITIITTVSSQNTWRQRFEEYIGEIFTLPDFLDISNFPEFVSYIIQSRQVDLIFLSNSYYGYYLMPWIRKEYSDIAIVDYIHMEEWYWRKGGFARTSGVIKDIVEKTYVCNERTRNIMIHDFNKQPSDVKTIYIGVDKDLYNSSKVESGLIKKELHLPADLPIILFPCRMHPQKRPFMMIEIAKTLKSLGENLAFVAVGDGPQLEEMEKYICENQLQDYIFLVGRQNDMRPYYKDASLTLICSLKEGLALTAYESLSMGTPVITSDVGGQAELIDSTVGQVIPLMQDEETQLDSRKFADEEISLYVNAIKMILSDTSKYKTMSKECRTRIEKGFSTEIMARTIAMEFSKAGSPEALQNRRNKSKALRTFPDIIDDYLGLYVEYELAETKQEEIWASREWFRRLYEQECIRTAELDKIHSMRTWKLIQKYVSFMNTNVVGKRLARIKEFIFQ